MMIGDLTSPQASNPHEADGYRGSLFASETTDENELTALEEEERVALVSFACSTVKRTSTRIWVCCDQRIADVLETVNIDPRELTAV
ncbi:MAG: hypothetical protein ACE5Q3_18680, partial [Alphaproteobacteria bacterium]